MFVVRRSTGRSKYSSSRRIDVTRELQQGKICRETMWVYVSPKRSTVISLCLWYWNKKRKRDKKNPFLSHRLFLTVTMSETTTPTYFVDRTKNLDQFFLFHGHPTKGLDTHLSSRFTVITNRERTQVILREMARKLWNPLTVRKILRNKVLLLIGIEKRRCTVSISHRRNKSQVSGQCPDSSGMGNTVRFTDGS